jgi:electron transport complex protein RnfE
MSKNSKMKILTNGFINENPVLRLVLGTCPTLAVTTMAANGIGMGLAATFVLICANVVISALRNVIPGQVRIPCYITVIAGFVTLVQMIVKAFIPSLDASLGVFLPLIVVNCIILGRAEMFASKNGIFDSALDGLGMGIGFTITLTIMGSIREILGSGTWMSGLDGIIPFLPEGFAIKVLPIEPFTIMTSAPGGFFVFGVLMAGATWLTSRPKKEKAVEAAAEGGNA